MGGILMEKPYPHLVKPRRHSLTVQYWNATSGRAPFSDAASAPGYQLDRFESEHVYFYKTRTGYNRHVLELIRDMHVRHGRVLHSRLNDGKNAWFHFFSDAHGTVAIVIPLIHESFSK
jgi:hypothetical protein